MVVWVDPRLSHLRRTTPRKHSRMCKGVVMGACEIMNDYLRVATLYEAKALRIMGMGETLKPASALTAAGTPK